MHALLGVHVLHAVDAASAGRFLARMPRRMRSRCVGDDVVGRDPLAGSPTTTTASDAHDGDDRADHRARDQADDDADDHGGDDAVDVEAQHAPPRRVALEDDLLAGVQVHRGPTLSWTGGAAADRPGRAADDGPRAARAVRLRAPGGRRRRLGARRAVRPPRRRRRRHRAGGGVRARRRRAAAGARGRRCRPTSSSSRCGWRATTPRPRRGRCRCCCRRRARGRRRRCTRAAARDRCRRTSGSPTRQRALLDVAAALRRAPTPPRCGAWRRAGSWRSSRASYAARPCTSPVGARRAARGRL